MPVKEQVHTINTYLFITTNFLVNDRSFFNFQNDFSTGYLILLSTVLYENDKKFESISYVGIDLCHYVVLHFVPWTQCSNLSLL